LILLFQELKINQPNLTNNFTKQKMFIIQTNKKIINQEF
jgi:hypothetical protein